MVRVLLTCAVGVGGGAVYALGACVVDVYNTCRCWCCVCQWCVLLTCAVADGAGAVYATCACVVYMICSCWCWCCVCQ